MKLGINVNISRLVWGQIGGSTKNNDPIKTILITPTPPVWGQDWGAGLFTHADNMGCSARDLFRFSK